MEHAEPCRTEVRHKTLFNTDFASSRALFDKPAKDEQNRYALKASRLATRDFKKKFNPFPCQVSRYVF